MRDAQLETKLGHPCRSPIWTPFADAHLETQLDTHLETVWRYLLETPCAIHPWMPIWETQLDTHSDTHLETHLETYMHTPVGTTLGHPELSL